MPALLLCLTHQYLVVLLTRKCNICIIHCTVTTPCISAGKSEARRSTMSVTLIFKDHDLHFLLFAWDLWVFIRRTGWPTFWTLYGFQCRVLADPLPPLGYSCRCLCHHPPVVRHKYVVRDCLLNGGPVICMPQSALQAEVSLMLILANW